MDIRRIARLLFHVGCYCLSIGLGCLGILSLVEPSAAADMFGIAATSDEARQWVRAAGLRDLALGFSAFALYLASPQSMRVFVPTLLPLPIGDAMLTLAVGGKDAMQGATTHLLGTVAIGILSACAWLNTEEFRPKDS